MSSNVQQRLDDLRRRINDLADEAAAGSDVSQTVAQLEQTARELLADAKNTPYETATQALFAELARLSNPAVNAASAATVRGLLRRARIRIEIAGDDDDIDEAIDILEEALSLNPKDEEVIALLQDAASRSPSAAQRVGDLFSRLSVERPAAPAPGQEAPPRETARPGAPPRYPTSSGYPPPEEDMRQDMPPGRRVPGQGPIYAGADIDEMVSDMTQAYYAGDYQQTIDHANRVLAQQPGNATALEYRQKAEDNLIRGIVPDHRVPFDARVAYNRANSLVRAGNYEEAERLYREARDLAERSGILSWKDAEQALLDIQDLALARELLNEGDRLMATDNWSEALRKYEGALRVVPNDPQAEDRVDMVRRVQNDTDQATVQLSMLSGALPEQVAQLNNVLAILARVRQLLPNSQRLQQLQKDANNRLAGIKAQIRDQSHAALTRAANAVALEERLALTNEALRLLELGVELDPADSELSEMLRDARTAAADMQRARQIIERSAALIAQNFDNELAQARTMLAGLRDYAQDERYRAVVSDLLARYFERAEMALDDGDVGEAENWMETMRDDPFRILGRRAELQRLEKMVAQTRQQGRTRLLAIVTSLVVIGAVAGLLTRESWLPVVFPPPPTATYTPSITPTPSDTPRPTMTFTPSDTPTPTPSTTATNTSTWTWTPSPTVTPSWTVTASLTPTATLTPTHTPTITPTLTPSVTPTETPSPTITPTPPELCRVVVLGGNAIRIRPRPTTRNSPTIGLLNPGQPADVLEQVYEDNNRSNPIWYHIRVQVEGNLQTGWIRADTVTQLTNCPPPP